MRIIKLSTRTEGHPSSYEQKKPDCRNRRGRTGIKALFAPETGGDRVLFIVLL